MDLPAGAALHALDPRRPYKPLDVGEAGVVASVNDRGRLVYVGQAHPEHGVVTLTATSAFPEERRFDAAAVRRYRWRLAARTAASFGLTTGNVPGGSAAARSGGQRSSASLIEHAIPVTRLTGSPAAVITFVPHPHDADGLRGVVQVVVGSPPRCLRWRGALRLERGVFPELTETDPLPQVPTSPSFRTAGTELTVYDPTLRWAVALSGDLSPETRLMRRSDRVHFDVPLRPNGSVVALGLGCGPTEALEAAHGLASKGEALLEAELERWRARWSGWPEVGRLHALARRGVSYVMACCAVPVGEATCLVTDHRILPLAWTRDGYFMARALLDWFRAARSREAVGLVRRHLTWLFEVAERPEGWWARSHLVGGQRKDRAFQLDQQLYPLLELTEYVELTGDGDPLVRYRQGIDEVLRAVEAQRARGACLFASEETPADDALDLPYQTSNQILAWWTFSRLHAAGVGGGRLRLLAASVSEDVRRHQVVATETGTRIFAYATDLAGRALLYHDANDLPMALAPSWGFCPSTDPVWRATVKFAFSTANPGFFTGPRGGLGSRHTPGPWPLGHLQSHMVAESTGDTEQRKVAEQRLLDSALWDGSLPEANDPGSGRPRSRPWFAWPGAVLASALFRLLPMQGNEQLV